MLRGEQESFDECPGISLQSSSRRLLGGGETKKCSLSFSRVGVKTIKLFQFLLGRQYDSEMVFDRKALRVETHLAGTRGGGGGSRGRTECGPAS